ncbi:hypothetical protein ACQP6S_17210, partial [Acinetobacter baumannii]|uniref:hypothetical protein n=1 Tax=Acinetobacter baumannii TaxID=470 RepID=UPI003D005954
SSFENYIAEKAFTDRFVQQSRLLDSLWLLFCGESDFEQPIIFKVHKLMTLKIIKYFICIMYLL